MSMSSHVAGIVPPDDRWQKMKAAWDTCEAAGVPVPDEVMRFFGDETPDDTGNVIDIPYADWSTEMRQGFEVRLADVPPQVQIIRFWNSW